MPSEFPADVQVRLAARGPSPLPVGPRPRFLTGSSSSLALLASSFQPFLWDLLHSKSPTHSLFVSAAPLPSSYPAPCSHSRLCLAAPPLQNLSDLVRNKIVAQLDRIVHRSKQVRACP